MILKHKYKGLMSLIAIIIALSSCFKEDEKVPAPQPGDLETMISDVGENYTTQNFVDLNTLEEKSILNIADWDLAFECKKDSFHVLLNSALMMLAGNTYDTNFATIYSPEGLEMNFDVSSGNLDSTAIGIWYQSDGENLVSKKQVYVLDRGIDGDLNVLGFKKFSLGMEEEKYIIRYANLDGSEEKKVVIEKDENYNYIHLSFENGIIPVEPPKADWTLKFSRYSTLLFTNEGDPYPYNVIGVLSNPNHVQTCETSDDFFNITLSDTTKYEFRNKADVIGFNWKYYNFDDGLYTIAPDKNYVLKDKDGFYYKLRFTSFYDNLGNKGAISYEVKRL